MTTYTELMTRGDAERAWRRDVAPGLIAALKASGAEARSWYTGDTWHVEIRVPTRLSWRVIATAGHWSYAAAVARAWREAVRS